MFNLGLSVWRAFPWRWLIKFLVVATLGMALVWLGLVWRRIAIARSQNPQPQAILVLDGSERRIRQSAIFAQQHPDLPIWVSGNCSQRASVQAAFAQMPAPEKVQYDLRATDTVTHFTTLVDNFTAQNIRHMYLVTSDYHMGRAQVSATLILGSRGIVFTPVSLPSGGASSDLPIKSIRDGLRSFLWLMTGRTGAMLNPRLRHLPGGVSCLSEVRKN